MINSIMQIQQSTSFVFSSLAFLSLGLLLRFARI
jgi:hypothetical protein